MKGKYAILWVLLLISFYGCSDKKTITDTLHRAEALMNEYPDSAYTLLQTLPVDELQQTGNRARYALLYSQALDKNYIDETNDSLINIAVDYYRTTDDVHSRFLAFYYQGRVYTNAGELHKAILAYTEAEQLADEVKDGYLLGLLYTQMGDIYKNYYDYPNSLKAFKQAADSYQQAGKELHRLYALNDQTIALKNMGRNDESYQLLSDILEEANAKEYNSLVKVCMGNLLMQCIELGRLNVADSLYQEINTRFGLASFSSSFMANVAEIHALKKEWDLSQEAFVQAWQSAKTERDSIFLYLAEARIQEMRYPQTKAYYSLQEGLRKQTSSVQKRLEQPILSIQNNLLATELEYQQYKLRVEQIHRWCVVGLVILISIVVIYSIQKWLRKIYRRRMRERLHKKDVVHQLALERLLEDIAQKDKNIHSLMEQFNEKMDSKDLNFRRVLAGLEGELASKDILYREYVQQTEILNNDKQRFLEWITLLFSERIEFVDKIIRIQHTDYGCEKMKATNLDVSIEEFQKRVIKARKAYVNLEELVNISCHDIMVRLRTEVKLPDEESYRQACYHFAGFSVYSISILMNETKNKIYKRRDRIRKRIEELRPDSMDLFIRELSK